MDRYSETKRVLNFMKSPDNMPKTGAKLKEENTEVNPDQIMDEILAEEETLNPKKAKKTKKKKAKEEMDGFSVGEESTKVYGSY